MISVKLTLSTTEQKLSTLLAAAGITLSGRDGEKMNGLKNGFIRNRDGSITVYVESGYETAPSGTHGEVLATKALRFDKMNAYQTWVKSASGTPVIDVVIGSDGIV